MSDFKMTLKDGFYDIAVGVNDFEREDGLETYLLHKLFLNTRDKVNGFWFDDIDELQTGSKLYLLEREKITPETIELVRIYTEESLKELISYNVADEVEVTVKRSSDLSKLEMNVKITKGSEEKIYNFNWEAQNGA